MSTMGHERPICDDRAMSAYDPKRTSGSMGTISAHKKKPHTRKWQGLRSQRRTEGELRN
jgi:hypothetical protein